MLLPQVDEGKWQGNIRCNIIPGVDEFPRRTLGDTVSPYHEFSQW